MSPTNEYGPDFHKYLFEYDWNGDSWCFTLRARSVEEAEERFAHLGRAQYRGVIGAEIRVPNAAAAPTGLFVRFIVWWKNFRRAKSPLYKEELVAQRKH